MPVALITGVTGQDGSYLAEYLLELGYEVHGLIRRTSGEGPTRIDHLMGRITLHEGDMLDQGSLIRAIQSCGPDEFYNLAAQSFVGRSWKEPVHTAQVTGLGALRALEAVRLVSPHTRFYQASSSEMYGNAGPARPDGPFHPRSPYGSAKLFAHTSAVNYRESYGMFVSCGVLFNHESPRRGPEFVTRKIAIAAARIKQGTQDSVALGNLEAKRDWGWAPDYVRAMHAMLQTDQPRDWILGTGRSHSVREFARAAFGAVGLDYSEHVTVDPAFFRPAEIDVLTGDPTEAMDALSWEPTLSFSQMAEAMVTAELGAKGCS